MCSQKAFHNLQGSFHDYHGATEEKITCTVQTLAGAPEVLNKDVKYDRASENSQENQTSWLGGITMEDIR